MLESITNRPANFVWFEISLIAMSDTCLSVVVVFKTALYSNVNKERTVKKKKEVNLRYMFILVVSVNILVFYFIFIFV